MNLTAADPIATLIARLEGVRKTPGGYEARCPAHDDRHASLSIHQGDDGRALVTCHAGCTFKDIAAKLGMELREFFPARDDHGGSSNGHHRANGNGTAARGRVVAQYDYRDAENVLRYQVQRYHPKDFRQRHPDGNGGWVPNMNGVKRLLYRLPELLNAREDRPNDFVFVCEGEKDVDRLREIGLIATTNVGGAGKWRDEDSDACFGAHVVILADNDDPGRKHADKVAASLYGKAASVRILALPGLPDHGDVSDWLDTGGTAEKLTALAAGVPVYAGPEAALTPLSVRELIRRHPHQRPPLIYGLLRRGEIMNIIAPSKTGKSWMVNGVALSVATGRMWLETHATERGDVLILDNELHPESTASRIPKVAAGLGILTDEYADRVEVVNLRGKLLDIFTLEKFLATITPGRYALIILDAFYRFMPRDMDENDNGTLANIYNQLDKYAARLDCSFILIHHSSKGSQSDKATADVGAGAGAQSRATDTHFVLRQHEQDGAVVIDALIRSWPPMEPFCVRWDFPVWKLAPDLNPADLRRPGKPKKRAEEIAGDPQAEGIPWTPAMFVETFLTAEPMGKDLILAKAAVAELSGRKAGQLLIVAESEKLAHRWTFPKDRTVYYATREQMLTDVTPPEPKCTAPAASAVSDENHRPDILTHTRAPP